MNDKQDVINHLQILWTWLTVNPKYGITLMESDCEKAASWVRDAIKLLEGVLVDT